MIQANYLYVKKILKDEFEYGTLSADNIEHRLDELMDLDTSSIKYDVLDKGYDTSLIKTPEDLQDFLKVTFEDLKKKDHIRLEIKNIENPSKHLLLYSMILLLLLKNQQYCNLT